MDLEHRLFEAQLRIPHVFRDVTLLEKALKGGDTNSDDREGHRGMAQPGDALINWVIMNEGFARGLSRGTLMILRTYRNILSNESMMAEQVQTVASVYRSKDMCSQLARAQHFDQLVRCSAREKVPQPTTLKNTLASIVQAVWIDSKDYHEVVRVMTSLGLLNLSVPSGETGTTMILPPDYADGWDELWGNLDAALEGVDWETLLPDPEIAVYPPPLLDNEIVAQPSVHLDDSESSSNQMEGLRRQDFFDAITIGPSREENATSRNVHISKDAAVADTTSQNMLRKKQSAPQGSNVGNDSIKSPGAKRGDLVRSVFRSYIRIEQQKFEQHPQLFKQYYGHFELYADALASIATQHSQALARIVVAIGDCSTLPLLKQAVLRARSSGAESSFHVKLHLLLGQRIEAIRHLDVCMAHLRLARLLHIHCLYKESARYVRGQDADGFIVSTQRDWDGSMPLPHESSRYGNPRNLDKAAISTGMVTNVSVGEDTALPRPTKHLRRIGQRLQMMINRWSLGVLCLVGAGMTDEMLMSCTDATFANFLTIIDRFEGDRIRATSDAALQVIGLFMGDGAPLPTFQLETCADEVLKQLPRLSPSVQKLFTPMFSAHCRS